MNKFHGHMYFTYVFNLHILHDKVRFVTRFLFHVYNIKLLQKIVVPPRKVSVKCSPTSAASFLSPIQIIIIEV